MTFRGLHEDKATRQFRVFTTLDSHVKVPVEQLGGPVALKPTTTVTQYPTGVAYRSWELLVLAYDPELRGADL